MAIEWLLSGCGVAIAWFSICASSVPASSVPFAGPAIDPKWTYRDATISQLDSVPSHRCCTTLPPNGSAQNTFLSRLAALNSTKQDRSWGLTENLLPSNGASRFLLNDLSQDSYGMVSAEE